MLVGKRDSVTENAWASKYTGNRGDGNEERGVLQQHMDMRINVYMKFGDDPFFRALGDETRRRLLFLLYREGELCVCELTAALALGQPKISRHLAYLRGASLVSDRRQGQWIFYRLRTDLPAWAMAILAAAHDGARDRRPYLDDEAALAATPGRRGAGLCC